MFCVLEQTTMKEEIFYVPAESTKGMLRPFFKLAFDILVEHMIEKCTYHCFVYIEIYIAYIHTYIHT